MDLVSHEPSGSVHERANRMAAIQNGLDGHWARSYSTAMAARTRPRRSPPDYASVMRPWPQSWAGIPDDIPIGKQLVELFLTFVAHLSQQDLTVNTIRRHVDHLWCIRGEIFRDLHDDHDLRRKPPAELLHAAIADGFAPFVRDASEEQQRGIDATARRLAKFLASTRSG